MSEEKDEFINLLREINLKLNLILGEIMKSRNDSFVIKDLTKYLFELGLDSKNISQVLGITSTHASKEVSMLKKTKKEKKNGAQKTKQ
jgi:hypothetical protein